MVLNKKDLERAFSPSKIRKKKRSTISKFCAENSSNMRVVVRIRPENAKELQSGSRSVIKVLDDNTLIFDPKEDSQAFFYHGVQQVRRDLLKKQNKEVECIFDQVFDSNSTNQEVFDGSTKDMIASLLDGYNCSVFAYGATGAGKTYTMLGNKECPGITYLTMSELYRQIDKLREERDFELGISHLEVYNENVHDLIEPSGPLHLREDGNCGVLVAALSVHRIQNAEELLALLERGNRNRTQHPTDANAESSRSHAVFQVYIRMTSKHSKQTKIVKLSMIDLAGSERGSATGCKGMRFTEGANINRSLLALGNCINNLADGLKHIPYRDSKLTRLLKDSLGGNCRTVMIANISPSSLSYEDTYNTLKYALRAKKIRSTLKKNIVSVQLNGARYAKLVQELSSEVESLKEKLKQHEKKLKEYESNNASSEVKPSTSRCMEPPVLIVPEKCNKFLELLETKIALQKEICKLGKEVKTLKWRIRQKLNTAHGLPDLSINPSEMCKSMNRIKTSVCQFEGRAASIREKMKKALLDLKAQIEKEVVLSSELEQNGSLSIIAKDIALKKLTLEKEEKTLQIEHLQQLLSMQQRDNENQFKLIKELCTTLKEYHFTLMGHDRMTYTMSSHYQKLVRMLEGMKAVSWQEDQNSDDSGFCTNMKDFCDLSITSLNKETEQNEISSKIFEVISANFSKQFSLSSVLPPNSGRSQISSQGSTLNNTTTIVTSSPVKDKVSSQGPDSYPQLEVAFELPSNFQIPKLPTLDCTFLKPEGENGPLATITKSTINADVLNSTFEIKQSPRKPTPPEQKSRVLADHNRLQPNIPRTGSANSGLPSLKKRPGSTPPEVSKALRNKENKDVFAKPQLPLPAKSSKPAPLRKQSPAVHLPSVKLPLSKNVHNIPRSQHIPRPLNNPVPISPRYVRTPQKQFKHDWRKMPADRRRSQSLRMKPYTTPSKSKTG